MFGQASLMKSFNVSGKLVYNIHDIYVVLVVKTIGRHDAIVGHLKLPRQISTMYHLNGGIITCTVSGRR